MNTRKKFGALFGAAALGGMLLAASVSATAFAADNTQYWQGQGVTDGALNNVQCDADNAPGSMLWIWTGTGSNVTLSLDGTLYVGTQKGNGTFQFATDFVDISTLVPGDSGNVFVTYDGAADANAQLTLSHGCPGETSSSSTSSSSTSTSTSFTGSESGETDATEPNTASVESGTPNSGNSAWLLIAMIGVVLGSAVVLKPSRAKTDR
jgi:hypothetical protein